MTIGCTEGSVAIRTEDRALCTGRDRLRGEGIELLCCERVGPFGAFHLPLATRGKRSVFWAAIAEIRPSGVSLL
jgi:hypothetical protein